MLTIFSTPKPFQGYIGIIQRNAIQSWKRLHPDVDVILFGDDDGAAEASAILGARHVPSVQRNEHGTKFLSSIFDQAQDLARHEVLCYINCDIVLLSDYIRALSNVTNRFSKFLMVGRRWDTDILQAIELMSQNGKNVCDRKLEDKIISGRLNGSITLLFRAGCITGTRLLS